MPDWPGFAAVMEKRTLQSLGLESSLGKLLASHNATPANAVWPTANTAIYVPVVVQRPCTVYRMSFFVSVQSGNYDIGIYDEAGVRLVSKGSTAVPAANTATATDITDTPLTPGTYFLALNIDNTTCSTTRVSTAALTLQTCGVQVQAVGAVTLPSTATFANPANAYAPAIVAHLAST